MLGIRLRTLAGAAGAFISAATLQAETRMNEALALTRWHGFRELRGVSQNTIIFCVMVGMAALVVLVLAANRRRRRWF